MKRKFAWALAMVMSLGMTVPAMAAEKYVWEEVTLVQDGYYPVEYTFHEAADGYGMLFYGGMYELEDPEIAGEMHYLVEPWPYEAPVIVVKDDSKITVDIPEEFSFWNMPEGYSDEFDEYIIWEKDNVAFTGTQVPTKKLNILDHAGPLSVTTGSVNQLFPNEHTVADITISMGIYGNTYVIVPESRTAEFGVYKSGPEWYRQLEYVPMEEEPAISESMENETAVKEPVEEETIQRETVSSWAADTVTKAQQVGIVPNLTGAPAFKDSITREQFAELAVAMVEQVCGDVSLTGEKTFADCSNENVLLAAEMGIVSGMGEGKFAPKTTTNREQIATMVNNAINYINERKGIDLTPVVSDISKFSDKDMVSSWAKESVGALAANGIMSGTSATTLSPKDSCTVEQSIMLLYRVYEAAK